MMIVVTDEIAALEREISEQKSSSTKASVSLHDTDLASQLERVTGMLQLLFFFFFNVLSRSTLMNAVIKLDINESS